MSRLDGCSVRGNPPPAVACGRAARGARRSSRRNIGESINVIIRLMNDLIRYVFESVSFRFGCLIGCLRVERFEHVE